MIAVAITPPSAPRLVMVKVEPELVAGRLAGAGRLGEPLDVAPELGQRLAIGVADHRHDEAVLRRGGEADVEAPSTG